MVAVIRAIEADLLVWLDIPDATTIIVPARLRYEPSDPYAVHLLFWGEQTAGEAAGWAFARELLAAGLHVPAGIGDVRIWPDSLSGKDFVGLGLSSDMGQAIVRAPHDAVADFLRRTYLVVPDGEESEYLDVDALITKLLKRRSL